MNASEHPATESEAICMFGIYFCKRCRNMMTPYYSKDTILYFKCQSCGPRDIDYKNKKGDQCLLMKKELKKLVQKETLDLNSIFDPTMPTVEIKCPECGYGSAIYFLIPDESQTKIVARMMCKNATGMIVKCGHIWDLNDQSEISETKVTIKQLEEEDQFDI